MTSIVLYRPGPDSAPPPRQPRQPKAKLIAGKTKLVLPFAPTGADHTPTQRAWSSQERPGRAPLMLEDGTTLATMRWTFLLAHRDVEQPIEQYLDQLQQLSRSGARVKVTGMSRRERGPWLLTDVSYAVTERQAGTNAITRATVTVTFTEPSEANPKLGPVHGGKKGGGKHGHHQQTRHYVVRKGDTLRAIANRFYDDPSKWPVIAKANHIKDPTKLRIGQRLTIPPLKGKDGK